MKRFWLTDMADHLRLLKMISLTVAIPTIVCAVCTACICLIHGRQSHGMARQQNFDPTVTLQPSDTSISGLDQSSIESYTKVVLGESRRLPMGPNDGTCPICLSDYRAEEVVRCIPECQHCFHAGCIDVWLRLNNSCPVCRNSPSPAHGVLQPVWFLSFVNVWSVLSFLLGRLVVLNCIRLRIKKGKEKN